MREKRTSSAARRCQKWCRFSGCAATQVLRVESGADKRDPRSVRRPRRTPAPRRRRLGPPARGRTCTAHVAATNNDHHYHHQYHHHHHHHDHHHHHQHHNFRGNHSAWAFEGTTQRHRQHHHQYDHHHQQQHHHHHHHHQHHDFRGNHPAWARTTSMHTPYLHSRSPGEHSGGELPTSVHADKAKMPRPSARPMARRNAESPTEAQPAGSRTRTRDNAPAAAGDAPTIPNCGPMDCSIDHEPSS